jgi:hypothetical protein
VSFSRFRLSRLANPSLAETIAPVAIFVVAVALVRLVPESPFVAYLGAKWQTPAPSRDIAAPFAVAVAIAAVFSWLVPHTPPRPWMLVHRAIVASFLFYAVACGTPA